MSSSLTLYEDSTLLDTAWNDADGDFSFATINYTLCSRRWQPRPIPWYEKAGGLGGVTYASNLMPMSMFTSQRQGRRHLEPVVVTQHENAEDLRLHQHLRSSRELHTCSQQKTLAGRDLAARPSYRGSSSRSRRHWSADREVTYANGTIPYTVD